MRLRWLTPPLRCPTFAAQAQVCAQAAEERHPALVDQSRRRRQYASQLAVASPNADTRFHHADVGDQEFASWLQDCSDILYEGSRPKFGDAVVLGRLGARLDLAMQTPSMIVLEPFEGLGALSMLCPQRAAADLRRFCRQAAA